METNKPNNTATPKKSNYRKISEMEVGDQTRWPIEKMNVIRATSYKISRTEKKLFSTATDKEELVLTRVK